MRFSATFESSIHCRPSPDGKLVASLSAAVIHVRAVQSALEVIKVIELPQEFAASVLSFQWSPSSQHLLVALVDEIRVVAARISNFQGVVRNPVAPGDKPCHVGFGPSDAEVVVGSSLGLKFSVFHLGTSQAAEVANPKFFTSPTLARGFSFRPGSKHLALLTRQAGRDMVSIHDPSTKKLQRSWSPDTVDAQSLMWSPDGRWLVICESASQGHKIIFYTPDGHLFKAWPGPADYINKKPSLGLGVSSLCFSPDGRHLAVCDSSKVVSVIETTSVGEEMQLHHPPTIAPTDTLQIWQENTSAMHTGSSVRTFIRPAYSIAPAGSQTDAKTPSPLLTFDVTSTLLATRLDQYPSTVWVWDVDAAELRAVLLFHFHVIELSWHPTIGESLLIQCDGDQNTKTTYFWDPLSGGPRSIDLVGLFSSVEVASGIQTSWLNLDAPGSPFVLLASSRNFVLGSFACADHVETLPWTPDAKESPLVLVPACEESGHIGEGCDYESELEDTFIHKR